MVAEKTETERRVRERTEEAESLAERSRSRKWRKELADIGFLLSKQLLAERPSLLQEMCRKDGVVVEDLYSIFAFGLFCSLQLRVPRVRKTRLTQFLFSDEICSHTGGPLRKQKRLSPVRLPPLIACSVILAHIEEKYLVLVLHVDSAKKEKTAQLDNLFTRKRLRKMMEGIK